MRTKTPQSNWVLGRLLAAMFVAAALSLLVPAVALARSYEMGPVTIDATLMPDGTLAVTEDRTFEFDGEFNGVYWKLPKGEHEGRAIEPEVESCGVVAPGGSVLPLELSQSGFNGTYELNDYGSYLEAKLYNHVDDEDVTYRISYRLPALASAWSDTGELYWKFVSDGWDETSRDVTCTLHLPVPPGASVEAGQNVRAWGHGTLDGSVRFDGDDVVFTVPAVGTDDFAEARVTFPVSWLSAAPSSEARLGKILAEEQRWADEANARREAARAALGAATGVMAAIPAATGVLCAVVVARYKKSHRPVFQDEYFRDVPTDDHPAVLGALYNKNVGTAGTKEFTASLMRLSDLGAVDLSHVRVPKKGAFGREKEDYRLTRNPRKAEALTDPLDRSLMDFVFDKVAPKAKGYVHDPFGHTSLDFSQMKKVAKKHPQFFVDRYGDWKAEVEAKVIERGFLTETGSTGMGWLVLAIVLNVILFIGGVAALIVLDGTWQFALLLLPMAAIFAAAFAADSLKKLSREGIETRAKLQALRRWLKDFTLLNEAVPRDVVLWNRLLVMAVALDVADEVIEQLRVAVPELFEDEAFMPTSVWYTGYGHMGSPFHELSEVAKSSYEASTAAVAASSDSSGGGGGGGFSGGGGGGFGGGGGGGAF